MRWILFISHISRYFRKKKFEQIFGHIFEITDPISPIFDGNSQITSYKFNKRCDRILWRFTRVILPTYRQDTNVFADSALMGRSIDQCRISKNIEFRNLNFVNVQVNLFYVTSYGCKHIYALRSHSHYRNWRG